MLEILQDKVNPHKVKANENKACYAKVPSNLDNLENWFVTTVAYKQLRP
jgi:hypothetical protein